MSRIKEWLNPLSLPNMRKVNKEEARQTLYAANACPNYANDEIGKLIDTIITGTHKTYKYILATALLAKSTNEEIDILSLQAKDETEGAYDARSLCHGVIVPFEREFYPNSLGGSNEPFLNKPARFPRLSMDNAVREGKDKQTLFKLVSLLSRVDTKHKARKYLSSLLYSMRSVYYQIEEKYAIPDLAVDKDRNPQTIMDYVTELVKCSNDGETCPLVISAIEAVYHDGARIVVPHKVNESGSSSKEVGDIDIFDTAENLLSSIEVKDKDFTKEDVEHAITKFAKAQLDKSLFVFGRNVDFNKSEVYKTAAALGKKGYFCSVISVLDFARMRIYSMENKITLHEFMEILMRFARKINAKNETLSWIKVCAENFSVNGDFKSSTK